MLAEMIHAETSREQLSPLCVLFWVKHVEDAQRCTGPPRIEVRVPWRFEKAASDAVDFLERRHVTDGDFFR